MQSTLDKDKLTNAQKATFAILLSEGFEYNSSFEASIFYGKDIKNARIYAKTRNTSSKTSGVMRVRVSYMAQTKLEKRQRA